MKRLWIAVGLLSLMIGLCLVTEVYQHRKMEEMLANLDRLEEAYQQGDISGARELAYKMADRYEQISRVVLCFTAHSDMAESQETIQLLPALLRQDGNEELGMEIARLREELTYLRNIDDPLIWNIL